MRLIIAVISIIGGIITSIGYFVLVDAGDDLIGEDEDVGTVYHIGYCILIGGLAVAWALDMAFDDVKIGS